MEYYNDFGAYIVDLGTYIVDFGTHISDGRHDIDFSESLGMMFRARQFDGDEVMRLLRALPFHFLAEKMIKALFRNILAGNRVPDSRPAVA
jgi:hypothetical protein